jgi:hypothetical protein
MHEYNLPFGIMKVYCYMLTVLLPIRQSALPVVAMETSELQFGKKRRTNSLLSECVK